jgi:putative peptidoglycan lipid II flippase
VSEPADTRVVAGDRLVRSSAAVAMGTLLSRVTGLLRVAVLAYAVGRASLADTYNLANSTPNIVYELLLGGVLSATLVPLFVDHLERGDARATSAVFRVALTAIAVLTAIAMTFAPLIARLYALDTTGAERTAQLHVMTVFTLWFLPQMVFYALTALASALLNARRRFVAAAYAPVLNNVIVIGVLAAFAHLTAGSRADWIGVSRISGDSGKLALLGAGTTAGIAAMALVLLPAMRHARTHLRAALAIVACPLAGAIGRESANRALVASALAALAGGIMYVIVLALLRAPELRSLFASLRRNAIPLDV